MSKNREEKMVEQRAYKQTTTKQTKQEKKQIINKPLKSKIKL